MQTSIKTSILILCGILICRTFSFGQINGHIRNENETANRIIGASAPDFTLTKFLQVPKSAPLQLSSLRGNVIVLEFWATWCAPCRKSMADLDILAKRFKNKSVIFLAISKESQSVIETFLKSRPNTLWMGVDSAGTAHRNYHVSAFPHTVIINKKGQVTAITSTAEITEERLLNLLEDKSVYFEPIPSVEELIQKETFSADWSLQRSILKRTSAKGIIHRPENTGHSFTTVSNIVTLWKEAYQTFGVFQLAVIGGQDGEDDVYQQKYFVDIRLPQNDKQAIRDTLRNLLEREVVDVRTEMRKKSVWVLQRKNGTSPPPPSDDLNPELSWERTNFKAVRQPIFSLAKYLNTMYNVVDETGLTGEYNLSFTWDVTKKNSLEDGLASLGLEIVKAEREIKVYVIKLKPHLSN